MSWFNLVASLDRLAYDFANEVTPLESSSDILIIAIDERSLLELGRWPWHRERHVQLLRLLQKAGVRAVAMDIIFSEPDVEYPRVDELLGEEIAKQGSVVLPVFVGQVQRGGQLLEIEPLRELAAAAARLGHVHIEVDSDGVARSVFLREGLMVPQWEHFSVALARVLELNVDPLPGLSDSRRRDQPSVLSIARSNQCLIPFMGPAGTVDTVSYVDVVRDRVPLRMLRNKVVFVGATAAGHADNITTSLGQLSGVEINANIFHALRNGVLARPMSTPANAAISFLLAFFTIALFTQLKPRALLVAVLLCSVLVPLASILMLPLLHIWFSPAPVVLTVLLAYPLWNWLRLDAAVDFIRGQLKVLEAENRKTDFSWTWKHTEGAAQFLANLGKLSGWRTEYRPEGAARDDISVGWINNGSESSKWFATDGGSRRLILQWTPDNSVEPEDLDLIFPELDGETSAPAFGGDSIDVDIAQLEFAYRQAIHNRELISSTLEQLSDGIILSDSSGSSLLLNEKARDLLALPANRTSAQTSTNCWPGCY